MKKAIILAVVVCICGAFAGLGFFVYGLHRVAAANAIVQVFNQRDKIAKASFRLRSKPTLWEIQHFTEAVKKIDTSRCPTEFQLAWFDYGVAMEKVSPAGIFDSLVGVAEMAGGVAAKSGEGFADGEKRFHEIERAPAALQRCQRIAIRYGVTFH